MPRGGKFSSGVLPYTAAERAADESAMMEATRKGLALAQACDRMGIPRKAPPADFVALQRRRSGERLDD